MAEGSSQILQQIEGLLAQLAQAEPEPEVQRAIQGIQKQVEPLQQILGAQDAQNMQSGLQNPTGGAGGAGGEEAPEAPGGPAGALGAGAGAPPTGDEGGGAPGGEHHVVEIHIGAGGPKTFGDAKKAAMAMHGERGHFDPGTPKGETPSSAKTKAKAKG